MKIHTHVGSTVLHDIAQDVLSVSVHTMREFSTLITFGELLCGGAGPEDSVLSGYQSWKHEIFRPSA